MEYASKNNLSALFIRYALALLAAVMMAACGGGGGSPGTTVGTGGGGGTGTGSSGSGNGTGGTVLPTITLSLADASGAASTTLNGGNPLTAKAVVKDSGGSAVPNVIVTFTLSDGSVATLSPSLGTSLTDASGAAQVGVQSANAGTGAVQLTATVTVGTDKISATLPFTVGAAPSATPVAINFVKAAPSDKSIVIKGSGGNGRTEVALLTFQVVDSSNTGVAGKQISFATQSSNTVTLASSTGITDQSGNVTVAVGAGDSPTTVRVIATVVGTSITALSDTITVTTGQPVATAFTIAQKLFYIEGLDFANVQNTISVYLADANGGAVADGTQVVFTTDTGAIVGSGGARCLTADGTCDVIWRSQAPYTASGRGTIIATATNSTGDISASASFVVSGSSAKVYHVSDDSTTGHVTRVPTTELAIASLQTPAYEIDLSANCTSIVNFEITDVNNNPMPENTALSTANAVNGTIAIDSSQSAVTYQGLNFSGGTVHEVSIAPTSCNKSGSTLTHGSFNLVIKTPNGRQTSVPVKFSYNM